MSSLPLMGATRYGTMAAPAADPLAARQGDDGQAGSHDACRNVGHGDVEPFQQPPGQIALIAHEPVPSSCDPM